MTAQAANSRTMRVRAANQDARITGESPDRRRCDVPARTERQRHVRFSVFGDCGLNQRDAASVIHVDSVQRVICANQGRLMNDREIRSGQHIQPIATIVMSLNCGGAGRA